MKTPRFIHLIRAVLVTLVLGRAALTLAADDIPARPPFDRYAVMMNKSPFAVATAVALPAATPNFAKDLYVANAARMHDGDLVTVQSAIDRNLKEYLTTRAPNEHGYAISNIEWSEKPGQTRVTISKDGQFATLAFNQALMATAVPQNGLQPPGGMPVPGQPSVPVPTYMPPKPPNAGGMPIPPPHARGLIQRNPSAGGPGPRRDGGADQ